MIETSFIYLWIVYWIENKVCKNATKINSTEKLVRIVQANYDPPSPFIFVNSKDRMDKIACGFIWIVGAVLQVLLTLIVNSFR